MLAERRVDLHLHTCLSPCADAAMIPPVIVARAREHGLGVIGVCDHNSGENARSVREAAGGDPAVLCGMEVTTREEVHLLALFGDPDALDSLQELVYRHLEGRNRPDLFGEQYRVDPDGHVLGINSRLLIGASDLSIDRVVREVHRLGGLAVACHLDRPSFSVISQLGTIPPGAAFDALEITGPDPDDRLLRQWLGLAPPGPG
ncbi:MAG: PHP domain-containing protein, partial [Spirochaetota bacterium]